MPETPRTWTLTRDVDHMRFGVASGPSLGRDEAVEVVKKAPVDAERERMLDLLEGVFNAYMADADIDLGMSEIGALLESHDRLKRLC